MGLCESTKNQNNQAKNIFQANTKITENGKYFTTNSNDINNQNNLVLNNDVIISELNENPETIYQKVKKLGEGSFGEVWQVRHKILGKDFAMKIIEKSPYSNTNQIINEIKILKQLDHPNILKILEFHLTNDKFYIITDYCKDGELFNEIDKKTRFTEEETSFIIYQILSAVRYCHKMRILHRDIKPENIMIMGRESNGLLHVKLIDFGTAKIFSEGNKQKALVGSSYYIAPEVIKGKYDEECDLWSVGVIMYIMLTGTPPFNGDDDDSILKAVAVGRYDTTIDTYQSLSKNAKDLITKLLTYNPSERITAKDALTHPWFQTKEFANIYRVNTINVNEAKNLMNNLQYYKSDNIIKCAVLAYLVHQNTNMKECVNASYLFTEIDLNKDGKLEKSELIKAFVKYYNLTEPEAREKANTIFLNIDTDNNGYIESEEFIRACIDPNIFTSENYLKAGFNYFDDDHNNNISVAEVEKKFYQSAKNKNENTRLQLRKMFDQIDINKDGQISFTEFASMIKGIISS